jgi:hypothetical protein
MKIGVKIRGVRYVNEVASYWSDQDFIELLKACDFDDIDQIAQDELKDMLYMALTDFEPEEAAEIVLAYKLGDQLKPGQIQALSNDMLQDKVAEEYPEPELHYDLFNINQLLFKAFNGTFPNTEASIITIELSDMGSGKLVMTEEIMTKLICYGLSDQSILKRLYSDQIEGLLPFTDAAKFIWTLTKNNDTYELSTSKYWIEKVDFKQTEYLCNVNFFEEEK